jgi:hypothetical protein
MQWVAVPGHHLKSTTYKSANYLPAAWKCSRISVNLLKTNREAAEDRPGRNKAENALRSKTVSDLTASRM